MRQRIRTKAVGVLAAVAVVGLGGAAVSARSEGEGGYRTALAGTHAVDQVLDAVGTVEPVTQAAVAFPTSGTVASVWVQVGDEVTVGQALAALDPDDLEVSLHEAQADLAQAELVLQRALDGEDVSSAAGAPAGGGLGRSAGAAADAALDAAQQAVLDAQQAVDEALAAAEAAVAAADAVCATAPTTTEDSETTTTTAVADEDGTCQQALAAALAAQHDLAAAQADLVDASSALTDLLEERAQASTTTTTPTAPTTPTTVPSAGGSGGAPTGAGGSSSSGSSSATNGASTGTTSSGPSAEDLIAYQKAVDAAALDVAVAEQALAQTQIVSPIAGTVAAVGLEVGDAAEAASATQTVVVVGTGGFEVTTKVSVTDLPDLEIGQAATVRPDGSDDEVAGEVVRIAVAPDTSGGSSTYAVTIGLTGDTSSLGNGSVASIEIVTAATAEALAVPTSAVTVDGDRASVQVVGSDGEPDTVEVEVGAVGSQWTAITDGLDEGDEVVLADLDEPLPGSATEASTSSSSGSGGGAFPGGGQPPDGFTFPGGGPPSGAGGGPGG